MKQYVGPNSSLGFDQAIFITLFSTAKAHYSSTYFGILLFTL